METELWKKRIEDLQDAVLETLLIHFGVVPECFIAPIRAIEVEKRLHMLCRAADELDSLDDFERVLLRG